MALYSTIGAGSRNVANEVVDNSERVRREIQTRLVGGLNNANEFLIERARDGAPVKSGNLRDGIEVISAATEANPQAIGAAKQPYSARVNRGDHEREAKPFWTTAWLQMKEQIPRFFRR